MITHTQEGWVRVGAAVRRRRTALGLGQEELVAGHPVSVSLLQDIENANKASYRELSIGRVERMLGWVQGSIDRIASGGDPEYLDEALGSLGPKGDSVVPPADAAPNEEVIVLSLPPGLTPRQRERTREAAEAVIRAIVADYFLGDDDNDVQPGDAS